MQSLEQLLQFEPIRCPKCATNILGSNQFKATNIWEFRHRLSTSCSTTISSNSLLSHDALDWNHSGALYGSLTWKSIDGRSARYPVGDSSSGLMVSWKLKLSFEAPRIRITFVKEYSHCFVWGIVNIVYEVQWKSWNVLSFGDDPPWSFYDVLQPCFLYWLKGECSIISREPNASWVCRWGTDNRDNEIWISIELHKISLGQVC